MHGSNKNYLKPKSDINTSFGLNHFAGVVFYDTRGKGIRYFILLHISLFAIKDESIN